MTHQCMLTTFRTRKLKYTTACDRDTAPETKNQDKKNQRRITAAWKAYAKHRGIFKGNIGTCLKRKSTTHAQLWQCHTARKHEQSPAKQKQARSRINKDGKEYVKLHIPGYKNKLLGKRKDKG
ncbi:hypothetical protein NP493_1421g01026 [Ridgeia piscesae]|uniref:Uncharacterized protein n=1 Tax=Ridgeia piscesae TaxID=27915 RepID=A0AAD9K3L8_RIDPI|nr:hypothetical protein NP493_1421g01026 [Ridgeia piscesae]